MRDKLDLLLTVCVSSTARLPEPPDPAGCYERGRILNGIGYVSGQFPIVDGKIAHVGQLGTDLSVDAGIEAAELAAGNVVAQIDKLLDGRRDQFQGLLRVDGYLACADHFDGAIDVLNAASLRLVELLGNRGKHARAAIIVNRLPLDAPVELVVTFAAG